MQKIGPRVHATGDLQDEDLSVLRSLTGRDREWAENALMLRIHEDCQAIRVLAQMGAARALPALRESAATGSDEIVDASLLAINQFA